MEENDIGVKIKAPIIIEDSLSNDKVLAELKSITPDDIELELVTFPMIDILTNADILDSNIAGIFVCESGTVDNMTGLNIAESISSIRSTIPIFLRTDDKRLLQDTMFKTQAKVAGVSAIYSLDDLETTKKSLQKYIFGNHYPAYFVEDIKNIGHSVFSQRFPNFEVSSSIPYVIYDYTLSHIITAIVPFMTVIGTGFFVVQTHEGKTSSALQAASHVNESSLNRFYYEDLLCELANLIQGKFRYAIRQVKNMPNKNSSVLPLVINPNRNMISFGRHKPQLCFRFVMTSRSNSDIFFTLQLKVISSFLYDLTLLPKLAPFIDEHSNRTGEVQEF